MVGIICSNKSNNPYKAACIITFWREDYHTTTTWYHLQHDGHNSHNIIILSYQFWASLTHFPVSSALEPQILLWKTHNHSTYPQHKPRPNTIVIVLAMKISTSSLVLALAATSVAAKKERQQEGTGQTLPPTVLPVRPTAPVPTPTSEPLTPFPTENAPEVSFAGWALDGTLYFVWWLVYCIRCAGWCCSSVFESNWFGLVWIGWSAWQDTLAGCGLAMDRPARSRWRLDRFNNWVKRAQLARLAQLMTLRFPAHANPPRAIFSMVHEMHIAGSCLLVHSL